MVKISAISLGFCIQVSLGLPWAFFGGPTDRVGDSFNIFVHPLSKLCISDTHLRIREKHGFIHFAFFVPFLTAFFPFITLTFQENVPKFIASLIVPFPHKTQITHLFV